MIIRMEVDYSCDLINFVTGGEEIKIAMDAKIVNGLRLVYSTWCSVEMLKTGTFPA